MKKLVIIAAVLALIFSLSFSVHAFTTANIRPGYSALHFHAQGLDTFSGLRIGTDFGLTRTVGLEGAFIYGGGTDYYLDLGAKFRLAERQNVAAKVGFHGDKGLKDWSVSLGVLAEWPFTDFFRAKGGLSLRFGDTKVMYFAGLDYSLTYNTAIQAGVRRDFWTKGLGEFALGLRTQF